MRLNELPIIMLRSLIITEFIEITLAKIFKLKNKELLTVILVNVMTNPLVVTIPVYFNIKYGFIGRNLSLTALEIYAICTEALIYKKYKIGKQNPFILSFMLNGTSFLLGEIINMLI